MYSVEDLLVSHGYRVAKSTLSAYQHRTEGCQLQATDCKSANGMLNGYQRDPESFAASSTPLTKGSFIGEHEKSCVNKRRHVSSSGYSRSNQTAESHHAPDTGFNDRLLNEKPCWAKDKDIQYWRRRGQDFSVLLNHRETGAAADKITLSIDINGKRRCNVIDKSSKECHNSTTQNLEKVIKKVTVCPQIAEQQTSDGSCEKLEGSTSSTADDSPLSCPSNKKSLLMPKVILPETLGHMAISSTTGDDSFVKENKLPSQDNYMVHQDCNKISFAKPKYSRPSKPPSYEVHQQTWGAVDISENQDNQEKNGQLSSSKVLEPQQDTCSHDSSMEPPNYIPPPSYKSPPLLHASNQCFKKVPHSSDRPNISVDRTSTSDKKTTCILGNKGPFCKPANQRHTENCKHSVQYISFDDPRLKHIAAAQEAEKHNHNKKHITPNDRFKAEHPSQESNLRKREQDSAFIHPRNTGHHFVKREGIKHKQWLHISIPDQICCSLPENRDGATACSLPEDTEATHKLTLKKTHSDSVCETVTKVRKYEPESFVFSKKSSKRKLNETIFCLVSIPVKSDSASSDMSKTDILRPDNTDRMNMLKHSNGGIHEQRLLSASSSDLELQTLTGSMNNNMELLKQAQSITEENKQSNDLRSEEPRSHRELSCSGSWPGDQYKDQQTQTTDIPTSAPYNGPNESELHNKSIQSQFTPTSGVDDPRWPPENARPGIFGMKGQTSFSPSSNSAFSRTSLLLTQIPRTEPCQKFELPNGSAAGKEKSGRFEKNEIQEENPCNKKEVFGQFLLKPVNRRPWDVISELESMNKEFQDQEGSVSYGQKNVAKDQSRMIQMEMSPTRTAARREMLSNSKHIIEVEEVPMFQALQDKSKSEGWYTEMFMCNITEASTDLCKSSEVKEAPNNPGKILGDGLIRETKVQVKQVEDVLATKATKITKTDQETPVELHKIPTDKNHRVPDIGFHHFKEDKTCFDNTFFDVVKVSSAKFGQIGDNMIKKLSLADRNHGRSVPDLSKHFIGTSNSGDFFEEHNFLDIPENESLHERAARILGIDVADDCLTSNGSSEAQSPENVMSISGPQQEKTTRGKLSQISFSTKETPGVFKSILHLALDNERVSEKLKDLDQGQEASSGGLSSSEQSETSITRNAEKRMRNTSKMIETLQGKLASTPVRTAVDRLARMKEVDSVSRMRRLSIKSTDSGDELDEEKQLYELQDGRTRKYSTGTIYKRVISLDEHLLIKPKDVYDPTRVERV